jgi:cytochrome P450
MRSNGKILPANAALVARAFLADADERRDFERCYEMLFSAGPMLDLGGGWWVASSYAAVASVFQSRDCVVPLQINGSPLPVSESPVFNSLFLELLPCQDHARHNELRTLTERFFSRQALTTLAGEIRRMTEECLYPAVFEPPGCDVLGTLGTELPLLTSCLLLDIPRANRAAVRKWAATFYGQIGRYGQSPDALSRAELVYDEFADYMLGRARHDGFADGSLPSVLVQARKEGTLTDDELLSYFALFLLTGMETTTNAIGNAIWFLAHRPDVYSRLRDDPRLAATAFEEIVRLWGPIRLVVRQTVRPTELCGFRLPGGATVFAIVHAANRDPRRFRDPDAFVWGRSPKGHLGFGAGHLNCLGSTLARLIGTAVISTLSSRCSTLHASAPAESPGWIPSLAILGLSNLQLRAEKNRRQEAWSVALNTRAFVGPRR